VILPVDHIRTCSLGVGAIAIKKDRDLIILLIPKDKMATPFCLFKTLMWFGFQFTKVSPHFCELVLSPNSGLFDKYVIEP
jgi:hypothetical protein